MIPHIYLKLNKKNFTIPFLVSISLLSSCSFSKPKLRAFSCGDYYQLQKSNQELLKQEEELFIFDKKGKSYQYDYSSNSVYPYKLKTISGVVFKLKKSFIKGSKFYVDYKVTVNNMDGTAEMILDFDNKDVSGELKIAGLVQPIPRSNCKEIVLTEDFTFEY